MQTVQGNVLQSLRSVQTFLDENAEKLGEVVKTGARQRLDETIAETTRYVAEQSGNSTGAQNATGTSYMTNDTGRVGGSLYRYASLPFEIASVLLLVAIIGSVMLARTLRQEASADDIDPESLQELSARDPQLATLEAQSALEPRSE